MSHHEEEHHDSHGSNLGFSYFRLIIPGALLMLLMTTYSAWGRCCGEKSCCKTEKCEKSCSKEKKCEHGGHGEHHEKSGGEHH